ncbi:hypothetical protein [Lacipirellula limnantheis]|uniref:hypothetical protein n=1 Tax=Lacipirellula limnantheis TaxID=2528024 RepID=UPI0011A544BE|nr:hypothetical protein [Lacipirellula limnantheis]
MLIQRKDPLRSLSAPDSPGRRTIDLRPGDEVWARNRYRRILAIEVVRDDWLTADEASGLIGREGYIYRPIAK